MRRHEILSKTTLNNDIIIYNLLHLKCVCERSSRSWLCLRRGYRTQTDGVPAGASEPRAGGGRAEDGTHRETHELRKT